MEIDFKGKRALVTGAGKSIGRAIAKSLWSSGAVTYAISRTQADLDSLQEECPEIHTICIDLTADWDKTAAAVESVGHVDLLVNNAGMWRWGGFIEATEDSFNNMFNINVKSVLNVSQVVTKGMIERQHGGAIVNMSSVAAKRGKSMLYCSSKAALDQITRCMAVELGPHQIRVNSLKPAIVSETGIALQIEAALPPEVVDMMTQAVPLKSLVNIQNVVDATLYLLSDKAKMINGASFVVDGGSLCK